MHGCILQSAFDRGGWGSRPCTYMCVGVQVYRSQAGCADGQVTLWKIVGGTHAPALNQNYKREVLRWIDGTHGAQNSGARASWTGRLFIVLPAALLSLVASTRC